MLQRIKTFGVLCIASLSFASPPASAGELPPVHASVPFSFTAGKTLLPPGDYTVTEDADRVLSIRGSAGRVCLMSRPDTGLDEKTGRLIFEQTDQGYVLRVVGMPGRPARVITARPNKDRQPAHSAMTNSMTLPAAILILGALQAGTALASGNRPPLQG